MTKMQYPKRLIEVDLPIKRISKHARREKSIRHGHISTLHIWWARRPLAACRAVLCAALWPDPVDGICPEEFRIKSRVLMQKWADENLELLSSESFSRFVSYQKNKDKLNDHEELRNALLDFIADFANWDNSTNSKYIEYSRLLTQISNDSLNELKGSKILVLDPFSGGGSIPLEALRIGTDVFSSDLNPLAILLNKIMLEFIPKHGMDLAEGVSKWGKVLKADINKKLSNYFPQEKDGSKPIAYIWARTINCEGPGCGVEIPLIRSLWLSKKSGRSVALKIISNPQKKCIELEIIS